MPKLVTVATFMFSPQSAIPASLLESNDIYTYIKDELVTNTSYANAVGGVKLQVYEKDIKKATALLLQGGFITEDDLFPSKMETYLTKVLTRLRLIPKS